MDQIKPSILLNALVPISQGVKAPCLEQDLQLTICQMSPQSITVPCPGRLLLTEIQHFS